jgi:hemolysin activation/secretion protein
MVTGLSAGLGLGAAPVRAQDYQRIAPQAVPATPAPPLEVPAPAAPNPAQANRVIIPALKGMRFLDNGKELVPSGVDETGITFEDLALLDASGPRADLAKFLGEPLTFGSLTNISRIVIAWYRGHDRPFVDVAFPEQDLSSGVLQVVVTEFRVGRIKFEHNKWFSTDLLRSEVTLKPGDPIDQAQLQSDLDRLNSNPFRSVAVVAQPSATTGASDLDFDVADRLPVRVYAGYDNTGTPILGHDRWNLGFNWGNALWHDQQLSYQLTTSDDFWHSRPDIPGQSSDPTFTGHAVNYSIPVREDDRVILFGSYEEAVPRFAGIGLTGISGQASIRYELHLASPASFLTHDLQFGYDFKTTNNNLDFGGLVAPVTSEVDQFPLEYDGTVKDPYGVTTLQNIFVYSPGNITAGNKDSFFEAQAGFPAGPNPTFKANYVYDEITADRVTRLPYDASWVMRVTAQTADRNLLPSEQLGAGGYDSVRGYDERAAEGSVGLLLREELYTPPYSLLRNIPYGVGSDQVQLLTFWDYGAVRQKLVPPGAPSSNELMSVGVGMRYAISRFFTMRLDYGWQLRRIEGQALGQMAQLAITVLY